MLDVIPSEVVAPSMEDFMYVMQDVYNTISINFGFIKQAFSELKYWKESLLSREAQQNVGKIEKVLKARNGSNGECGTQPLTAIPNNDRSLKRKERWVDRLHKKRPKSKVTKKNVDAEKGCTRKGKTIVTQSTNWDHLPK